MSATAPATAFDLAKAAEVLNREANRTRELLAAADAMTKVGSIVGTAEEAEKRTTKARRELDSIRADIEEAKEEKRLAFVDKDKIVDEGHTLANKLIEDGRNVGARLRKEGEDARVAAEAKAEQIVADAEAEAEKRINDRLREHGDLQAEIDAHTKTRDKIAAEIKEGQSTLDAINKRLAKIGVAAIGGDT